MDRSFAGRLGIGSLTQPSTRKQARPRGTARRGSRARGGAGAGATAIDRAIAQLLRLARALADLLSGGWAYVRAHRRARIALIAALIALPLLAGGWLWLRQSPLVSVEHVRVSGVHGAEAGAIEAALSNAARGMSTLDVSEGRLRAAVASYPVVGDLQVHANFPHGLRIRVIEQPPVATLEAGGTKTAVAANGIVLGEAHASSSLPTLSSSVALTPGEHVREAALRGELAVLGAAPAPLAKSVERAYSSSKGLTLRMHGGLLAYFGDASRPHAKWASLARVLADPGSAGASYVDVRLPERPAAGFPAGSVPAASEGEASGSTSGNSESEESLAEGLSSAVGGSASEPAASGASEEASGEAEHSSESEDTGEAHEAASTEAASESTE
jgi:cell division protein FtsQ